MLIQLDSVHCVWVPQFLDQNAYTTCRIIGIKICSILGKLYGRVFRKSQSSSEVILYAIKEHVQSASQRQVNVAGHSPLD